MDDATFRRVIQQNQERDAAFDALYARGMATQLRATQGARSTMQILVTLSDRSQVGIRVDPDTGDAEVNVRESPGAMWEPVDKVDTARHGTAHVAGTFHIGTW